MADSPSELAMAVASKWRGLTPALAQQSAQVSALTKTGGEEVAASTVEALGNLLTFAAAQFNIGKNFNDVQLALLANDMLERYWHWRFDEFVFVLKEAVGGRYGTTYDRIDAPTVHGWCAVYEQERSALLDAEAQRRHKTFRLGEANREALLPLEQMPELYFRAKLEAMPDAELRRGIRFYWPQRAEEMPRKKLRIAVAILRERAAWAEHEATRAPTFDEKEEAYRRYKANWALEKEMQEMRDTGAEVID
ncbi:hypothetical protein [Hymenobacter negativus]|uniref:hypothetical protein n=1 Tax=Hymenobacter negativus TaxID=2795026 RepID=UPI0018DD38FF|nr:hypothetical protein [Hymenobacter negativus]MBH8569376.1 hypothetical protein [Hymenobacter negativus]